jgi:hemolysin activation/secretion protein
VHPHREFVHAFLAALLGLTAATGAPAQNVIQETAPRPELEEPEAAQDAGRSAPEAIPAAPVPHAGGEPLLFLTEVKFSGNTVIPTERLKAVAAPFEGHDISDADLQNLLQLLTAVYHDAGYATSSASIPDQEIEGGVIHVRMIEGRLAEVRLRGEHGFDPEFLRRGIQRGAGDPLNINQLQDHIQLLLQDPLFNALQGEILAGPDRDQSILDMEVEEGPRFAGSLLLANDRSPVRGGYHGAIEGKARNLFGRGDVFSATLGATEGQDELEVDMLLPLQLGGTTLFARYLDYDADFIEEPFDTLDLEARVRSIDAAVIHPLIRSMRRSVSARLGLSILKSESFFNGQPFSLGPGAVNGVTRVSALRGSLSWLERRPGTVLSASLQLSGGLDAFDATQHEGDTPDSQYFFGLLRLEGIHRLGMIPGQLYGRFDVQLANDDLLPLESFAIGGTYSVRGYRRLRVVRDNGWTGSLEYRVPVLRVPIPGLSVGADEGRVSLVAFFDIGRAWNHHDEPDGTLNKLYSFGPGLRWDVTPDLRAQVYWAALDKDASAGNDLQDEGVHFLITARRGF